MKKRKLVVLFDGTWNHKDQRTADGRPCPTNIVKLFEATCQEDKHKNLQITHYVQGIGTHKLERIRGGGFGYGISDDIKDGYRFLVRNYQSGDDIYIFGFSRGAYAARSLAGMIRNVGILRGDFVHLIDEAYQRYKDRSPEWHPDGKDTIGFREKNSWGAESIRFLGVFDTVGALGAPFGIVVGWIVDKIFRCRFHDTRLSKIIQSAYHALSIDERRLPFLPTPMIPNKKLDKSTFEEKWFPGVHSNVGGGYPNTGLSDLALGWMANKAIRNGLRLDLRRISDPGFMPDVMERPAKSQNPLYRISAVLFVKLPGCIHLVPKRYKDSLQNIRWTGDLIRPIPDKGYVGHFIGNQPARPVHLYDGSLHSCVIDKINRSWNEYLPSNVC